MAHPWGILFSNLKKPSIAGAGERRAEGGREKRERSEGSGWQGRGGRGCLENFSAILRFDPWILRTCNLSIPLDAYKSRLNIDLTNIKKYYPIFLYFPFIKFHILGQLYHYFLYMLTHIMRYKILTCEDWLIVSWDFHSMAKWALELKYESRKLQYSSINQTASYSVQL